MTWRVIINILYEGRMRRIIDQRRRTTQVLHVLLDLVRLRHMLLVSLVGQKMIIKVFLFNESF